MRKRSAIRKNNFDRGFDMALGAGTVFALVVAICLLIYVGWSIPYMRGLNAGHNECVERLLESER